MLQLGFEFGNTLVAAGEQFVDFRLRHGCNFACCGLRVFQLANARFQQAELLFGETLVLAKAVDTLFQRDVGALLHVDFVVQLADRLIALAEIALEL